MMNEYHEKLNVSNGRKDTIMKYRIFFIECTLQRDSKHVVGHKILFEDYASYDLAEQIDDCIFGTNMIVYH